MDTQSDQAAKNKIAFLFECYEAGKADFGFLNFFSDDVVGGHIVGGVESVFAGLSSGIYPSSEWGEGAQRTLSLYQRERALYYAALFVSVRSAKRKIFAPLLLAPAVLRQRNPSQGSVVDVLLNDQRINLRALRELMEHFGRADDFYELVQDLPIGIQDREGVFRAVEVLRNYCPDLPCLEFHRYPELLDQTQLKQHTKKDGLFSAAAIGFIRNSGANANVFFELRKLQSTPCSGLSKSILALLREQTHQEEPPSSPRLPAVLSEPQRRILRAAATAPLSVVIGPPGCGKSFSIAAAALDAVSRGESVLIACDNAEGLAVVRHHLEKLFPHAKNLIVGGDRENSIQEGIEALVDYPPTEIEPRELARLEEKVGGLRVEVEKLVQDWNTRLKQEFHHWGLHSGIETDGFFRRLIKAGPRRRSQQILSESISSWELAQAYEASLERIIQAQLEHLQAMIESARHTLYTQNPEALMQLRRAFAAKRSSTIQRRFQDVDFRLLTRALPIWLVTCKEVGRVLPLSPDLFDLAIIDEASQCDTASPIPVLQRARKAVIVGDPKQLRHVSFLSRVVQEHLAEKFSIDDADEFPPYQFSTTSLLDWARESVGSINHYIFLDEHFRSHPGIIEFSNAEFYRNGLKIMTAHPERSEGIALELVNVKGLRNSKGYNQEEVDAVVNTVLRLTSQNAGPPPTIGVLSPFRNQVEALVNALDKAISADIATRHRLMVGTPFSFQGSERDIMLISLAVDNSAPSASLRYLNRPNMNIFAQPRARHEQIFFSSLEQKATGSSSLLSRYLTSIRSQAKPEPIPQKAERSLFLADFVNEAQTRGYETHIEWHVAGMTVDALVTKSGRSAAVDLIGFCPYYSDAISQERQRVLNRAGLKVFPLTYYDFLSRREEAFSALAGLMTPATDHTSP